MIARRCGWLCVVAWIALLAAAGHVQAQAPRRFALNWVRQPDADACIASYELARALQSLLGPVLVAADEAELAIEGSVSHASDGARWQARITITDRQGKRLGERKLESDKDSCRSLDVPLVFVIGLAIDPEVALSGLPPELIEQLNSAGDSATELLRQLREEAAAKPVRAAAEPRNAAASRGHGAAKPRATRNAAAPRRPRWPKFAPIAEAVLGVGMLPEPSVGARVGLELGVDPRWKLALHAGGFLASETSLDSPTSRGAATTFHLLLATLTGCFAPVHARLRWDVCAGGALASRWTDTRGLLGIDDGARFAYGPMLSSGVQWPVVGSVFLILGAALVAPITTARYNYFDAVSRENRVVFEDGRVWGWSHLGLGMTL